MSDIWVSVWSKFSVKFPRKINENIQADFPRKYVLVFCSSLIKISCQNIFFNYTTGNFSEITDGQDAILLCFFVCLFFIRGSMHEKPYNFISPVNKN